jgi:hypothetical protein
VISPSASETILPIQARRIIAAEFMYRPRPAPGLARVVFDYALRARLGALDARDAVVWVVDGPQTSASLLPITEDYRHLAHYTVQANPQPVNPVARAQPFGWDGWWQQMTMTDRWSRILAALDVAANTPDAAYLLMPAHDAIYTAETLSHLIRLSERHSTGQAMPAAVSPYTFHQHSAVPGAAIPPHTIALLNTAFNRDSLFGWKMRFNRLQGFWGKMSLLPISACAGLRAAVEPTIFEDDLHIDTALRRSGIRALAWWVADPGLYRQTPPVFSVADVRQVLMRTLHYSLNIPGQPIGGSFLLGHQGILSRLRTLSPSYRRLVREVTHLIEGCRTVIDERLRTYGASWVDWGNYRYVVRIGDPSVQTWRQV